MSSKGLSLFHPSEFKGLIPAGQQCNALLLIAHPDFYQSLYRQKGQLETTSDFPYIHIKTRPCENMPFSENAL